MIELFTWEHVLKEIILSAHPPSWMAPTNSRSHSIGLRPCWSVRCVILASSCAAHQNIHNYYFILIEPLTNTFLFLFYSPHSSNRQAHLHPTASGAPFSIHGNVGPSVSNVPTAPSFSSVPSVSSAPSTSAAPSANTGTVRFERAYNHPLRRAVSFEGAKHVRRAERQFGAVRLGLAHGIAVDDAEHIERANCLLRTIYFGLAEYQFGAIHFERSHDCALLYALPRQACPPRRVSVQRRPSRTGSAPSTGPIVSSVLSVSPRQTCPPRQACLAPSVSAPIVSFAPSALGGPTVVADSPRWLSLWMDLIVPCEYGVLVSIGATQNCEETWYGKCCVLGLCELLWGRRVPRHEY